MSNEIYERLASALDAIPPGYPETASRTELRLLKKSFSEEEAELAGLMSRKFERISELATRVGWESDKVRDVLQSCLEKGLVIKRNIDDQEHYRLAPFMGVWYERLMGGEMRHDAKFAALFEQYMNEGAGEKIFSPRPGGFKVVPIREALKPEQLEPYDDIDAHFARNERFAVIDCICQIERDLVGHKCTKTLKRCAFTALPPDTPLSENVLNREQAIELFTQLEEEGLVHNGFYGTPKGAKTPQFIGCCNCCDDCCPSLRAINDWGLEEGPQRSNYRASLEAESCIACGDCVDRCQVHAIRQDEEGIAQIDHGKCLGCGLCVVKCPVNAIELVPVSAEEWFHPPSSFVEWEERWLSQSGKTR